MFPWLDFMVHEIFIRGKFDNDCSACPLTDYNCTILLCELLIFPGGDAESPGEDGGLPLSVLQGHLELRPLVHQAVQLGLALAQLAPEIFVGAAELLILTSHLVQVRLDLAHVVLQPSQLLSLLLHNTL